MIQSVMKRAMIFAGVSCLFLRCLFLATPCGAQEKAVVGHWEGAYVRLGSIQTVMLDLTMRDGKLNGTFDVPDLDIVGEPIKDILVEFPKITLRVTYGVFTLHVSTGIGEMTGENKKWNPPLTLHLKRKEKRPEMHLPREEVRFNNGTVNLAGTLVMPLSPGPYSAIVIIHGSGDQGRKDSYYSLWGEFFARHGVAALIYDKRGVGQSSGSHERATFDDLAADVLATVEVLKKRTDINSDQIGLFGISQGGWLAPLVASRTDDVKYLILNVGPAVSVQEQELDRVEYSLRAEEFSEQDIHEALSYTMRVFATAYTGDGETKLFARSEEVRAKKWADYIEPVSSDEDLEGWRLIRYDPAPVLRKTKIPLLALFGELDVLVPPQENADRMRAYLQEAGNGNFTIRVIPGVGHNMETFGTLKGGEWQWPEKYWIWPRKSPELYQTILTWLKEHELD